MYQKLRDKNKQGIRNEKETYYGEACKLYLYSTMSVVSYHEINERTA